MVPPGWPQISLCPHNRTSHRADMRPAQSLLPTTPRLFSDSLFVRDQHCPFPLLSTTGLLQTRRINHSPQVMWAPTPAVKTGTEPPQEQKWVGVHVLPSGCHSRTESEGPCHGPREWCLCHQAVAATWALSQLTGLRGGQRLAAAPGVGLLGSAGVRAGDAALERNRASSPSLSEPRAPCQLRDSRQCTGGAESQTLKTATVFGKWKLPAR